MLLKCFKSLYGRELTESEKMYVLKLENSGYEKYNDSEYNHEHKKIVLEKYIGMGHYCLIVYDKRHEYFLKFIRGGSEGLSFLQNEVEFNAYMEDQYDLREHMKNIKDDYIKEFIYNVWVDKYLSHRDDLEDVKDLYKLPKNKITEKRLEKIYTELEQNARDKSMLLYEYLELYGLS